MKSESKIIAIVYGFDITFIGFLSEIFPPQCYLGLEYYSYNIYSIYTRNVGNIFH